MKAWGGLDMAKAAEEALVKIDAVFAGRGARSGENGANPCVYLERDGRQHARPG